MEMLQESAWVPAVLTDTTVLGSSVWEWILAAAIALVVLIVLMTLRWLSHTRLRRLAEKTTNHLDDLLVKIVGETPRLFFLVLALFAGSFVLELSGGARLWVGRIAAIAVLWQVASWLDRVLTFSIERHIEKRQADGLDEGEPTHLALMGLFRFFGRLVIWSVVLLAALDNLGVDVTALIAGLGVGGIAVGLALQDVLKDTFAALSIVLDKPFELGDFIVVDELAGNIEHIGIKTTRVRSLSGEQLVFGNGDLLSSRIRNFKRLVERRALFGFGVLYSTPADVLERIPGMVREIVEGLDKTRFDRAHFKGFGDSSLDFEVVYYILDTEYLTFMDLQQSINLGLVRRFAEEGIGFAFPTRTLYVEPGESPLRAELVEGGGAS
ncbi:MAG: mechanosensitive ion channel family protein [Thermoanaerobaculia bacterium]